MKSKYNSHFAIICRCLRQYSSTQMYNKTHDKRVSVQVPNKKSWPKNNILVALHNSSPMKFGETQFERVSSADIYPGSVYLKSLQKADEDAKRMVQFLKENGGEFFKIDWNRNTELLPGAGDSVAKMIAEQTVEENDLFVEPTEFSILENLIESNDRENLCDALSDLIKKGTEVPEELKEKVFAYICDDLLSNKTKEIDQLQSLLSAMREYGVSISRFMQAATLRVYLLRQRPLEAANLYDEMSRCGHTLDAETGKLLILASRKFKQLEPLANEAINTMFDQREKSSAFNILFAAFQKEPCEMNNERDVVNVLGKYVSEMKHFTTLSDIEIYTEILRFVSNLRNNRLLIYTTLELLDELPPSVIENTESFRDAMRSANRNNDIVLAKRLLRSAVRHKNFMSTEFFDEFSRSVVKDPEFQGFFDATSFVHATGFISTINMYKDLARYCVERNWPVALPYLFAVMEPGFLKVESHLPWVKAAIELIGSADEDTVTQIKRIAYTLSHRLENASRNFTSNLCVLFCRCGDKDDVLNLLSVTNNLTESAVTECKSILGPNVNVLNIRNSTL